MLLRRLLRLISLKDNRVFKAETVATYCGHSHRYKTALRVGQEGREDSEPHYCNTAQ